MKAATGTLGEPNAAPLKIGGSGDCATFAGLIDEVEIFDRALSASEIQAIFNAGSAGKCKEEGGCPATVALEEDPQKETKLGVLYDFRDEVLANTPTGQRYIELFYTHAKEGVELMLSSPELLSHTSMLLERFLPMIQAVVAGQEVRVTAADLADIEALLEAFAVRASPELEADLRAIGEELRQGRLLEQFGIGVQ